MAPYAPVLYSSLAYSKIDLRRVVMARTRDWHIARPLLGWIVAGAGFALLRWTLLQGTYHARLENQRVLRDGGLWPAEFASWMTVIVAVVMLAVLGWQIATWFRGRGTRAAVRSGAFDVHRDILK